MGAEKVTTRRAALRRPRDHDTGHVIIGIGYAFACSCGATGSRRRSYREAMNEGREHAAAHTAEASAADPAAYPFGSCPRCAAIAPYGCTADPCAWPPETRDAANAAWRAAATGDVD